MSTAAGKYPPAEGEIPIHRFAFTIFCDDIREEANGKQIFIGTYLDDMYVSEFPRDLPSLALWIEAVTPSAQPFTKFIVRLYLDDKLLIETLEDSFAANDEKLDLDMFPQAVQRVRAKLRVPPFEMTEEGLLRVRIETDQGILKAGLLRIRDYSAMPPSLAEKKHVQR